MGWNYNWWQSKQYSSQDNIIKNNPIGLEDVIRMNMAKMNQLNWHKVWYNQFCNNGKDIDIYYVNDSSVIGNKGTKA